jgi:hypothetical protein
MIWIESLRIIFRLYDLGGSIMPIFSGHMPEFMPYGMIIPLLDPDCFALGVIKSFDPAQSASGLPLLINFIVAGIDHPEVTNV